MVTRKVVRWWWLVLLFLGACAPTTAFEPAATGIVIEVATASALSSVTPQAPPAASPTPESYPHRGLVWPTSTRQPGPYPPPTATYEPEIVFPTDTPEPTATPWPTRTPTPVVTPIPTAVPPIIPLPADATPEPFTLYYRDGGVIRSLSSTGEEDAAVFLDPVAEFGLYLTPEEAYARSWGAISPDGEQVALVLTTAPDMETYRAAGSPPSLYILDRASRKLRLLVEHGIDPLWSPDGQRIAFISKDANLSIVEVASGETRVVYSPDRSIPGSHHLVERYTWAPDSRRLSLIDSLPFASSELLVVDSELGKAPLSLINTPDFPYIFVPQWSPIDDQILLEWYEGAHGGYRLQVVAQDGKVKQLSSVLQSLGGSPRWSPDGQWILIAGSADFEPPPHQINLWLVDPVSGESKRLTSGDGAGKPDNYVSDVFPDWSPDGLQIVYFKGDEVWVYSLVDGSRRFLMPYPADSERKPLLSR